MFLRGRSKAVVVVPRFGGNRRSLAASRQSHESSVQCECRFTLKHRWSLSGVAGLQWRSAGNASGGRTMDESVTRRMADFSANLKFEDLPDPVVQEVKRLLLDTVACGLGG